LPRVAGQTDLRSASCQTLTRPRVKRSRQRSCQTLTRPRVKRSRQRSCQTLTRPSARPPVAEPPDWRNYAGPLACPAPSLRYGLPRYTGLELGSSLNGAVRLRLTFACSAKVAQRHGPVTPKGYQEGPCRAYGFDDVKVWQLADRRSVCPDTRGKIAA
jgi:hypothetical protein